MSNISLQIEIVIMKTEYQETVIDAEENNKDANDLNTNKKDVIHNCSTSFVI